MDNSYYTGATLIRATGGGCGGSKYHFQSPNYYQHKHYHHHSATSLAGSPLLMQSNILTGLPLIRNGQHTPPVPVVPPPPSSPPGLICCFQPIYYFPTNNNTSSTSPTNFQTQPMLPFCHNNNRNHKQLRSNHHHGQNKRKNYKMHQKPKQNNVTNSVTTENCHNTSINKKSIPASISSDENEIESFSYKNLPDPISPPPKQNNSSSSTVINKDSNHSSQLLQQQQFFTSSIESTKDRHSSIEEKQRNDKLRNFYFYDDHWTPKDDYDELSGVQDVYDQNNNSSSQSYCSGWDLTGTSFKNSTTLPSSSPTEEISNTSSSSIPTHNALKPQKDLEVEAQIITLANGHRDLEIRLCYVTS